MKKETTIKFFDSGTTPHSKRFQIFNFNFLKGIMMKKMTNKYAFISILVLVMAALCTTVTAEVVGPPIEAFETTGAGRDIVLSNAVSSYSANLTSYSNFISDIHTIAGYYVKDGHPGSGWADILYSSSSALWSSSACVYLGRWCDGNTAWVAYKFVAEQLYETDSGGTVTLNMDYTGNPATQGSTVWVGISSILTVGKGGGLPFSFTNSVDEKVTMLDLFGDNGYGTYHGVATLDIPDGLTEFYVILADSSSSGYMGYTSLSVDAQLRAAPAEPVTVAPPFDIYMTNSNTDGIEIEPFRLFSRY